MPTIAMPIRLANVLLVIAVFTLLVAPFGTSKAGPAQAMGYEPKYGPGFAHFDYVDPDAPKGGSLSLSAIGSFDSLNPFVLKGMSASGLTELVFESLMTSSWDEPFSQYGLLAEDVEVAADGLAVTYRLRPEARFSDGSPVTADDVVFSFDQLKGPAAHPQYRFYWSDIEKAVALDRYTVRFEFARTNPELPMIAGQIPIFSRHWVGESAFDDVVQARPIASGPYVVDSWRLGRFITFRRNPDYWARELPVRRGLYNFDRITIRYYRDATVSLEAFKAGEFDFLAVYNSKQWARDFVGARFDDGRIRKAELAHSNNAGMQGFIFNTRRPLFQDRRVRRAIGLAYDFSWANRSLFYGQYERCDSFFSNSDLAARGLPEGDELKLLQRFEEQLLPEVLTEAWRPPSTEEPGQLRANLLEAKALLREAGWEYRNGALRNEAGQPFRFDIMLVQRGFERIVAPFARNLRRLGIEVNYRTVDSAIYQRRVETFDFDMTVQVLPQSPSPGNELISMFHSSAADQEGSRNIMGLQDPVVDELLEELIAATDRERLVTVSRALDRVLLHGEYLVPNWYIPYHRVAYWTRFGYPEVLPLYYNPTSWALATWWSQEGR